MHSSFHTAEFLAERSLRGEDYAHLGRQVTLALLSQPRWIIRTVESVRFVDRNVVSRRVVRHFVIPRDPKARPRVDRRYLMPIYAVRKGQFISCDLLDEAGHSVSLAPLQDRWKLSYLALLDLVRRAGLAEEAYLRRRLWRIVESAQPVDVQEFEEFLRQSSAGRRLLESRMFGLVIFLARNYLIYRAIPKSGTSREHVLTMRLERRIPDSMGDFRRAGEQPPPRNLQIRRWLGLASHEFRHEFIQTAGSTHLEVEAPDGIAIGPRVLDYLGLGVAPAFEKPVYAHLEGPGTSKRRARFLIPRAAPLGTYAATINLRPGAGVMREGAAGVAGLLAGLTFLVAARRSHLNDPALVDAAATLLLVLPALAALVAARPAEHPRVTRVVVGPRTLTVTAIPLASLAAATLITGGPTWILYAIAAIATGLTVLLVFGAVIGRRRTEMDVIDTVAGVSPHAQTAQAGAQTAHSTGLPVELPILTRVG